MNFNKNIVAFAICLAMFSPIKSNDSEEVQNLIGEAVNEVMQEAATAINSLESQTIDLDAIEQNIINAEQAVENIVTQVVNSAPVQEIVTEIEEVAQIIETFITVSMSDASTLIENFNNNLAHGHKFSINNMQFVVDSTRKINAAEESMIESMISYIINSAITTIAQIVEAASSTISTQTTVPAQITAAESTVQIISQQAAITLLQQLANNLVAGTKFTLNGTNYVIEATN